MQKKYCMIASLNELLGSNNVILFVACRMMLDDACSLIDRKTA
jgi:hypothetical protein